MSSSPERGDSGDIGRIHRRETFAVPPAEDLDLASQDWASHGVEIMNGNAARPVGYGAGLIALIALGWILAGQAASPRQEGQPMDWSHRHVIFSQPSTDAQAAAVMHDPRYWQQFNREHFVRTLNNSGVSLSDRGLFASAGAPQADWSQNLGLGANAGPGVFPAKYAFQITSATCGGTPAADYVIFSTGLAGSASQASVVGYTNLYSGCTGPVPQVYWAYNTGGTVLTSPAVSGNGQVAFVQTNGGFGILVLLKWAASTTDTVTTPTTLTAVSNASYRTCIAPCMTTIQLVNGSGTHVDDVTSSVFPDYSHDTIWVGGALGWLHKITGVFRGTPKEVTTGGFPVQVSNTTVLSSPVHDSVSDSVFIGDAGGFLYRVTNTSPPVVTASGQVDFGTGFVTGPIVDSTAGRVYVFSSSDGTTNCTGFTQPCSAVYEFATNFGAGTTGTKAAVGASVAFPATPSPMFEAGFDSTYVASANATGNLYVCGNTGGPPTLYRIPINAGTMGPVVTGPVLSSATTGCSPVTDFSNPNATGGTKEWIFAGVQASGLGNLCASGGCAMNFVNTPWIPSHTYSVGQQVLDTHFQVQTCRVAGLSRTTTPNWNMIVGGSTLDNIARWTNQGPQAAGHGSWLPSHAYAAANTIIDSNGNVQVVVVAGTSRTAALGHPAWKTVVGSNTTDNTVTWRNVGLPATASLPAAGGTGGIIIDNVVGSGTLAGASQVYFSTQSNQVCGTSGTGGCAVQASQAALK